MALFNSFKFGDVDSKDYGVYISGDSVYDSPARSVDLVQVPGRNGALALDNGYYENIEVTYPAGSFGTSQEEWREKMLGIRNALAAQRGYQKLIDTYHPEHYRLGMFFAGISASPVQYNRAGQFPIRFNCKPQRFLISGDEAVEFTAEGQEEVYGPSNIVSFEAEEGAEIRQLEVDLEPVQDLNGYDNPWPAGGGKNQFDQDTIYASYKQSDGSFIISGNNAVGIRAYIPSALVNQQVTFSAYLKIPSGSTITKLRVRANVNGTGKDGSIVTSSSYARSSVTFTPTSTDDFVALSFGANGEQNLQAENIQLEAGSSATDFAPYSNICPISGHTEVNVYRTGVNVWDEEWEQGLFDGLGRPGDSATNIRTKNNIPVQPNTTYYAHIGTSGANLNICFLDENGEFINRINYPNTTFTTPSNCRYIKFSTGYYNSGTYKNDISINYPSTATTYEPFGQTYPIPLGQTVYGGTLNVTTGVLTVDRILYTFNGSEAWTIATTGTRRVFRLDGLSEIHADFWSARRKWLSNIAAEQTTVDSIQNDTTTLWTVKGQGDRTSNIFVCSPNAQVNMTLDEFKAMLASNPMQLVYPLATPTTVQLTPTQVSTLLGANNIWSDAGEVEVKVASPVDLTNPTNFPAKPLIRIYGNGSVRVGDTIATVQNNAGGYVDIDCESMNCYDTTGGRNADVSFSGNDFPELASGDNGILLTGPSKVEITPRWWEL